LYQQVRKQVDGFLNYVAKWSENVTGNIFVGIMDKKTGPDDLGTFDFIFI